MGVGSDLSRAAADDRTCPPPEWSEPLPFPSLPSSSTSNPFRTPRPLLLSPNLASSARLASLVARGVIRDVR
eukprot:4233008-Pyramimonas_sp.AAC.1